MTAMLRLALIIGSLGRPTSGYILGGMLPRAHHSVRLFASSLGGLTTTELPDSFEDAVSEAVESTLASTADGWTRLRIDFDTSAGDATYTVLKNSLPMTQKFIAQIAEPLIAQFSPSDDDIADENEEAQSPEPQTIRLYFPDAGSAALCQRDWKIGTPEALVPPCVRLASLSVRDLPAKTDACLVFICPRATEVDALKKILKSAGAWDAVDSDDVSDLEVPEIPVIFINPELVNMGVTGFGLAGRMLRDQLLASLVPSYYLRTLQWGAVTRAYPKAFSVWLQDETGASAAAGGYKLLSSSERLPDAEELDAIYENSGAGRNDEGGNGGSDGGSGLAKGLEAFGRFVEGFGRI